MFRFSDQGVTLQSPRITRIAPRVHLVGIGGAGMKALCEVLVDQGEAVSGSDFMPETASLDSLRTLGVEVHGGHQASQVGTGIELLIYSPAVPDDNPEREEARRRGIPEWSYPQALAHLTRERRTIAVSGTHGKSTTTALLAHLLQGTTFDPTVVCGAETLDKGRNGWLGTSDWAVVEACEYRRHFLQISPEMGLVLGIEPDHFDSFESLQDAAAAYEEFLSGLAERGKTVLYSADCPLARESVRRSGANGLGFRVGGYADWVAARPVRVQQGWQFKLLRQDCCLGEFLVPRPGRHDLSNSLAALATAAELGVSPEHLREQLATFRGLKRRFEVIGVRNGVTWIDDYAHHPTEVAAVLSTAQSLRRSGLSRRRIWCAFQPHQVLRTRTLFDEFVAALSLADQIVILPVFTARETPSSAARESSLELVSSLIQHGCRARYAATLDHLRDTVETLVRPGDIFLTLGAGDIGRVHHEFSGRVPGYCAG